MAIYRVIGKIVKRIDGGRDVIRTVKQYIRADSQQEAMHIAYELAGGYAHPLRIKKHRENWENDIGTLEAYASDNNLGILPGV